MYRAIVFTSASIPIWQPTVHSMLRHGWRGEDISLVMLDNTAKLPQVTGRLGTAAWSLEEFARTIDHNTMYVLLCAGERLAEGATFEWFAAQAHRVVTIRHDDGMGSRVLAIRGDALLACWKRAAYLLRVDPVSALCAWAESVLNNETCILASRSLSSARCDRLLQDYRFQLAQAPRSRNSVWPTVAIALVNHNMRPHVSMALASIEAQIDDLAEVWLVDDGSSDGSQTLLQAFSERVCCASLVSLPQNVGKARAANVALQQIQTDFILELDADDWLDPGAVRTIRSHLSNLDGEIDMLYGNMRNWRIDSRGAYRVTGLQKGGPLQTTKQLALCRFPLGPRVYRTSTLKTVGGFPILSFANGRLYEDVALIRELLEVGRIEYRDFTVYNRLLHRHSITHQHVNLWPAFVDMYLTR
ncbi:glycosyl transferase family 2 [Alicyclobacillus sacchari]|uniref:Glycosyl transferase family 2 n=1 Tax=Alicyclobacillus sacchari TaxID=392010 RepID=A0A4R8LGD7_9BACL|nr:glycosyltransferase family A protein [Alicyclobacillus sacchari]TDY42167.1 glycosyl transferase family 2 [Alicyclobacillus sacchari]GMA58947.1 hypothetical protein GCM10025858_34500 [Alicyclobacillus sacchari]